MRCAVVSIATGEVINVIVAELTDRAPDSCVLIGLDDTATVGPSPVPEATAWRFTKGRFESPVEVEAPTYRGVVSKHIDLAALSADFVALAEEAVLEEPVVKEVLAEEPMAKEAIALPPDESVV